MTGWYLKKESCKSGINFHIWSTHLAQCKLYLHKLFFVAVNIYVLKIDSSFRFTQQDRIFCQILTSLQVVLETWKDNAEGLEWLVRSNVIVSIKNSSEKYNFVFQFFFLRFAIVNVWAVFSQRIFVFRVAWNRPRLSRKLIVS